MSRYIDADALYKELCEEMGFDEAERFNDYYLGEIPTADVIPIEWIKEQKDKCFPYSTTAITLNGLLTEWEKERRWLNTN